MKFTGSPASHGLATGRVCIIDDQNDIAHCEEGGIAVLVNIKPTSQLMKRAAGVVALYGGVTSHAAIAAREHKKPAVIGVKEEILTHIKNGDSITVDGSSGVVSLET